MGININVRLQINSFVFVWCRFKYWQFDHAWTFLPKFLCYGKIFASEVKRNLRVNFDMKNKLDFLNLRMRLIFNLVGKKSYVITFLVLKTWVMFINFFIVVAIIPYILNNISVDSMYCKTWWAWGREYFTHLNSRQTGICVDFWCWS